MPPYRAKKILVLGMTQRMLVSILHVRIHVDGPSRIHDYLLLPDVFYATTTMLIQ
jgi:hypothetical protein